jgi:hypothetical protein
MKRRDFITLIGVSHYLVALPVVLHSHEQVI